MMALYMPMQPFIEDAQNGFVAAQIRGQHARDFFSARRQREFAQGMHVARYRASTAFPASQWRRPMRKKSSRKSPLHNVLYATPALVSEPFKFSIPTRPGHWPLQLATVRIGPAMRIQAVQQVMAILPDGLHDNQRRLRRNFAKDFHTAFLAIDETMLFRRIVAMAAAHLASLAADGLENGVLGLSLGGPTHLISGQAQIPVGDQNDRFEHANIFTPPFARVQWGGPVRPLC